MLKHHSDSDHTVLFNDSIYLFHLIFSLLHKNLQVYNILILLF